MCKCIFCNIGCVDYCIVCLCLLCCLINLDIIYGDVYKMWCVNCDINVVVIGVGIVGMEVVCIVVEVGCYIWLLEVKNYVGGFVSEIFCLLEKKCIVDFLQFMKNCIVLLDNLMLQIGKWVDVVLVFVLCLYLIVNVIGLMLLLLFIEGLWENIDVENGKIFFIIGMIDNLVKFIDIKGKCIVVVGVGVVGFDVIEYFIVCGVQVVLIEMQDVVGCDFDIIIKNVMLIMFDEYQVEQYMNI